MNFTSYESDLRIPPPSIGDVILVLIVIVALSCLLLSITGCTWSPKFAPLVTIEANGSANGNTVPVSAAP